MLSNTIYEDYLFNSSGALAINTWTKIGDKWYYGNQDGKILRISGKKLRTSGITLTKTEP